MLPGVHGYTEAWPVLKFKFFAIAQGVSSFPEMNIRVAYPTVGYLQHKTGYFKIFPIDTRNLKAIHFLCKSFVLCVNTNQEICNQGHFYDFINL